MMDDSEASDLSLRSSGGCSTAELNEQVVNALRDVYRLLELYAPAWYTEELHKKTVAALRAVENLDHRGRLQSQARTCRDSGRVPSNSGAEFA